jgi:hypothetical protein
LSKKTRLILIANPDQTNGQRSTSAKKALRWIRKGWAALLEDGTLYVKFPSAPTTYDLEVFSWHARDSSGSQLVRQLSGVGKRWRVSGGTRVMQAERDVGE